LPIDRSSLPIGALRLEACSAALEKRNQVIDAEEHFVVRSAQSDVKLATAYEGPNAGGAFEAEKGRRLLYWKDGVLRCLDMRRHVARSSVAGKRN
jgi:hypothetical protein